MAITLPTTIVPASAVSPKLLVIYGAPKIGKTTKLTELLKVGPYLIIDSQKGTKYIDSVKVDITNLAELVEVRDAIVMAKKPYKFACIDVIDEIETWCEADATAMYKLSPVGQSFKGRSVLELPNGNGYHWLRLSFYKYLDVIKTMADHIILVGHIRDKYLTTPNEKEVSTKDLDLTGKIRNIVCSQADAIGHMYRKTIAVNPDGTPKTDLWINFSTQDNINCGSRCKHLKGQEMQFDWSKIYIE